MARDVSRAQKALAVGRWQRFVRGVKRIMTAVSLVAMAGLLGFATKLATDMPVEAIAITGEMRHVDRRDLERVICASLCKRRMRGRTNVPSLQYMLVELLVSWCASRAAFSRW